MSDLLSEAREAAAEPLRNGKGWYCCDCGELIGRLADEVERLRAIINAKLHRRKCHDCGHVGWYADSRTPYCLCDQCRSQDTRLVKVEGQNCEVKP